MSEFTITKIESDRNWGTSIEFIIQVNEKILKTFYLGSDDSIFSIPLSGEIKITSKEDTSDFFLGSVSLDSSLVPRNQLCWLPLYRSLDDRVTEIPCKGLASAWIELTPSRVHLNTVEEVTEYSGSELMTINSGDISLTEETRELLSEERGKNRDLENQVKLLKQDVTQLEHKLQERELKFHAEIDNKERIIASLTEQIEKLRRENAHLREYEQGKRNEPSKRYSPKINSKAEKKRIVAKKIESKTPEKVVPESKNIFAETPKLDQVDLALKEKLREMGKTNLLVKEEENIYSIGKRKVFIELKQGNLLCRAAGGYKTIEEYISDYERSTVLK